MLLCMRTLLPALFLFNNKISFIVQLKSAKGSNMNQEINIS